MEDAFRVHLSRVELLWLGRAFSRSAFPLLLQVSAPPEDGRLDEQIAAAEQALTARGWVEKITPAQNQVSALGYLLVSCLSDPEFSLVIESLSIQGEHTLRVVHVNGGRLLGVLVQPDGYDLTIYLDRESFQTDLTGWLGLADHPLGAKENHILPDNEPMELIKLAWKSPEKAQTALRVANNPSPDATLAWAQSLQTASLMSAYSWAASESPVAQLFASANQSGAWMGSWSSESDQNIHLEPVDKDPALEKIFAIKLHPVIEKPD